MTVKNKAEFLFSIPKLQIANPVHFFILSLDLYSQIAAMWVAGDRSPHPCTETPIEHVKRIKIT